MTLHPRLLACICSLAALASVGCERSSKPKTEPAAPQKAETPESSSEPTAEPSEQADAPAIPDPGEPVPTRIEAGARVVAVGDIHGDLDALRESLSIAAVIDSEDNWAGGETVLVQTGDQLDRGDDEPEILALLEKLEEQAAAAGGRVVVLNGNHETMNVRGDLRYVTPEGFADYRGVDAGWLPAEVRQQVPEEKLGRVAAFLPGGPAAKLLAHHNVVAVVGETLFVHGGVLPEHVDYGLERINEETRKWMRGQAAPPEFMQSRDPLPPMWVRTYSQDVDEAACRTLATALEKAKAKRMVVGHTPQQGGATPACDGRVWRIDVGMSDHYGGTPQALLIEGDQVRVLGGE